MHISQAMGELLYYTIYNHVQELMQKRRNSIAKTLELRLFCIKPSIFEFHLNEVGKTNLTITQFNSLRPRDAYMRQ